MMSTNTVTAFDTTIEKTNIWIKDVMEGLGWEDRTRAYHALRAVLHALRDRLTVEETVDLGAQLPMLLRGMYYDGWTPRGKPVRDKTQEEFLAHITDAFRGDFGVDAEKVVRMVFAVLSKHITGGEIEDVKSTLPDKIRSLWS